ncbi:hypothetical protein BD410DRAFT_788093 [Rickenella mellea]|uniref:Uncharacterized protein n=1 Tax=Rickenella mellea TaxID=50990 RepID=A0A4Y7Q5C4_9AGAM|nr:hypothetical protein BD410DRAFT_788093 [Rickenella mellea]
MAADLYHGGDSPFTRRPDNRHEQLLTPVSHFPSRMLPPVGTTPRVFSGTGSSTALQIGATVEVRRFNIRTRQWMPWRNGRVVGHRVERFHVGAELDLYDVETGHRPHSSVDTYIPFLGELRDGCNFQPSDSVKELLTKVADMKKVFAYVAMPGGPQGKSPVSAWMPAIVMSKRAEPVNRVSILAGPLRGQTGIPAPHILPYNPETAEAIRKNGQQIFWENGTV